LLSVLGDRITLPYLFRQNGYYTMNLGKIFHGRMENNDVKAWDEIHYFETTEAGKKGERRNLSGGVSWMAAEGVDEDQEDGQKTLKAVELISVKREKPFFLAVGFSKPHDPFYAPKKYFDMYPLAMCNPPVIPEGWVAPYKHTLPSEPVFNKFTDQDKREHLRSYYACTSFMDAQVGKRLKALEETGQMDNTLIVFMGDNGYHLGEHNWWNKQTVFEKATKDPFIVAGNTAGKKGVESDAMFEFIDIYPTLAEVMGLKNVPDYLEGRSFSAVLKNPSLPFRSSVRAVVTRGEMLGRTVKTDKWRYTEWDNGKMGNELYDQGKDPVEYNNLATNPSYSGVVTEMKKLLYQKN